MTVRTQYRFEAMDMLLDTAEPLERHLETEGYRGYDDRYGAFSSPLFGLPALRYSKWVRIPAVQALKRLPVNPRPLLRVQKRYNAVSLAFAFAAASAYLANADLKRAVRARPIERVAILLDSAQTVKAATAPTISMPEWRRRENGR